MNPRNICSKNLKRCRNAFAFAKNISIGVVFILLTFRNISADENINSEFKGTNVHVPKKAEIIQADSMKRTENVVDATGKLENNDSAIELQKHEKHGKGIAIGFSLLAGAACAVAVFLTIWPFNPGIK